MERSTADSRFKGQTFGENSVIGANGWLAGVDRQPSPNCDQRPAGSEIELVVIHCISLPPGEFGGTYIADLFMNRLDPRQHPYFRGIHALRVSAHVLIRRNGGIIQFVPFAARAWHAGMSCFRGRKRCNDFSIGVELEGEDETAYDECQYRRLLELLKVIRHHWPAIGTERIVGHSDIAPGRKTDPGPAFDWLRLRAALEPSGSDENV